MTGNCTTGFSLLETHVCSLNSSIKPTVKLSGNPPSVPVMTGLQSASECEPVDSTLKRKGSTPVEEGHTDKRQRTEEVNNVGVEEKNVDGEPLLQ